uniref:LRRCT domain-containing protein n=1 Tax=Salvator merianae TaxID=96440 RepID=A0A8D0DYI8_SALMN
MPISLLLVAQGDFPKQFPGQREGHAPGKKAESEALPPLVEIARTARPVWHGGALRKGSQHRPQRMGPARAGEKKWIVMLFIESLLAVQLALGALEETFNCSIFINFEEFQSRPVQEMSCVNLSGIQIDTLNWSVFSGTVGLKELYLSNCGISDIVNVDDGSSALEILYMDHNQLSVLPDNFLRNAPSLHVIHLESNQLRKLPETFLKTSDHIQKIHLDFNNLTSLPPGIFKPSLHTLELSNNSWDCTCTLLQATEKSLVASLNIVCNTPERYHGENIKNIPKQELCRIHSLTALFICLPLMAVLVFIIWCLCKQRQKTGYAIHGGKDSRLATVERNGAKGSGDHHSYIPCELSVTPAAESEKNILLKNQVLLKPSTALLGSNRDLYEEVEIKLGASDDSLVQTNEENLDPDKSDASKQEDLPKESFTGGETEAETVSVTDVLKDSADREKLYMNQSVDYYNLVPGIELEDSDHMEYENIDLC